MVPDREKSFTKMVTQRGNFPSKANVLTDKRQAL